MAPLPVLLILLSAFFHAGWNLIARNNRDQVSFLLVPLMIGLVGIIPAILAEFTSQPLLPNIWYCFLSAGFFQAVYFSSLMRGYQYGDFTVVYPVARALPVLILALADIIMGFPPSVLGWSGLILVFLGCLLSPQDSIQSIRISKYWTNTMRWIVLTAVGTVGYTLIDNYAANLIQPGFCTAVRYQTFEMSAAFLIYYGFLKTEKLPIHIQFDVKTLKTPFLMALLLFGAYSLVLWTYQITSETSYIVALRQFSIVIGVVYATFRFHEPAPVLRISAALMITVGVFIIAFAG